jgi:hypothetical protein
VQKRKRKLPYKIQLRVNSFVLYIFYLKRRTNTTKTNSKKKNGLANLE